MPVTMFVASFLLSAPPPPPLHPGTPNRYLVAQAVPPDTANPLPPPLSDAEKVSRANRLIQTAKDDLKTLQADLDDPDSEFARSEKEFQELDAKHGELAKEVERLKSENQTGEAAKAEAELVAAKADWETARDRFDLAIRQRKTVMEKITALKAQVERGQQWLANLEGTDPDTATPAPTPAAVPVTQVQASATTPTAEPAAPPAPPVTRVVMPLPGLPVPTPAPAAAPPVATPKPEDADVRKARELAEQRKREQAVAEEKAKSIEEREAAIRKDIEIENRLLNLETETAAKAGKVVAELSQILAVEAPQDPTERAKMEDKLADANRRLTEAKGRIKQITDRLGMLQDGLAVTLQRRAETTLEADRKKREADAATASLTEMLNPLASRNVEKWLTTHGPNLVAILIGVLALYAIVRSTSRSLVTIVANRQCRGSEADRDNRVNTLVGVFRSMSMMAILGGGTLVLLDEAGVPVVPLMGGAAVLGLAVAFGAQNLIKDYFSGFMILMEDQYGVNDVVRIGGVAGSVEKLTPRVTVLRDLEGNLHFIPHGTITNVTNMTHTWSRALFEIPVPYDADLDRAMHAMMEVAHDMKDDMGFGGDVLAEPEMLGVDSYGDSAIMVRFIMKTRPVRQWAVKREVLRRIKHKFDSIGIGIPFPIRTVYHKFPDAVPIEAPHTVPAGTPGVEDYSRLRPTG